MTSAQFSIEGTTCPAAVDVGGPSVSVDLEVLSLEGIVSTTFSVANEGTALSSELSSAPTISNTSRGKAQFTFPAGWDTDVGAAVGIRCDATDQYGQVYTAYGIAGVANALGFVPPVAGEELWRDALVGWRSLLDDAIQAFFDIASQVGTFSLQKGDVKGTSVALPSGATSYVTVLTVPLATWLTQDGNIATFKVKAGYGEDGGAADSQDEEELTFTVARASASSWTLKIGGSGGTKNGPSATPSLTGSVGYEAVGYQITVSSTDLLIQLQRDMTTARNAVASCTVEYPTYYTG